MSLKLSIANTITSLIDNSLRISNTKLHRYVVHTMFSRLSEKQDDDSLIKNLRLQMITPPYVEPEVSDYQLIERIYTAFRRAKNDQKQEDVIFMPSSYWHQFLNSSYPSYPETDINKFGFFLSNFGAWESNLGINWTYLLRQYVNSPKSWDYFAQNVFGKKLQWWIKFESMDRNLSDISQPRYGNQWGCSVNGHFLSYESVLNDFYARMISNFLKKPRPVIGEIGAGYGILFYFISKALPNFCYLDFDLPETLSCATYYLMKSFPNKKFLLYGEGNPSDKSIDEYDFILMPSFTIQDLPNDSVDIFINMSSLGEMKPKTCQKFVHEICRTSHSFWHMNHEYFRNKFEDGTTSLINREYPVDEKKFCLLIRYIDALNAAWQGHFEQGYDIYGYYYARTPVHFR